MRGPDRFQLPRARELRRETTRAEAHLWEQLRARRLQDAKFVRQHPVGPYVADFACRRLKLVIEVDGATHSTDEDRERDAKRTAFLGAQGFRVLRVSNDEVMNGMDEVLTLISAAIAELK